MLFKSKDTDEGIIRETKAFAETNIPPGWNWTDCPTPGSIVLLQQPEGQSCSLLGDIMATRLHVRGIRGAVVDGRIRDVQACTSICNTGEFQIWSTGLSASGPSNQAKPWMFNVSIYLRDVCVRPGDILVADPGDRATVIIPRHLLHRIYELLPILKEASEGVVNDVRNGLSLPDAIKRHPNFYSNYQ